METTAWSINRDSGNAAESVVEHLEKPCRARQPGPAKMAGGCNAKFRGCERLVAARLGEARAAVKLRRLGMAASHHHFELTGGNVSLLL